MTDSHIIPFPDQHKPKQTAMHRVWVEVVFEDLKLSEYRVLERGATITDAVLANGIRRVAEHLCEKGENYDPA